MIMVSGINLRLRFLRANREQFGDINETNGPRARGRAFWRVASRRRPYFQEMGSRRVKMREQAEVVNDFMLAVGEGDFASARKQLADALTFQGPFDTFNDPDSYLEALRKLHPIV